MQRWVKFVKYLRLFGWEPIVYTPENPEYPSEDFSFAKDIPEDVEILKRPIWEPYDIYRSLTGKKGKRINAGFISENKKSGWKDRLSIWLRGNLLIPDPRRFWIKPSVKFLTDYLIKNPVDAVITTGPPHSMHLIGLELKKKFPKLKWIADFRDPWTNIDFYKDLNLTKLANKVHHRMEREVVQGADCVVVVSNEMMKEFAVLNPKQLELITNGFDKDDVADINVKPDKQFTLSHIGTLNAARNPKSLWKVLGELVQFHEDISRDLRIQLIGKIDFSVTEDLEKNGLSDKLIKADYIQHNEAIIRQQSSQVLLLLINNTQNAKGVLTGKFFEYLASGRLILAVGPSDGDVAEVLRETGAGQIADFEDEQGMKSIVLDYYENYKKGELAVAVHSIEKYSRKELTERLANLLNSM